MIRLLAHSWIDNKPQDWLVNPAQIVGIHFRPNNPEASWEPAAALVHLADKEGTILEVRDPPSIDKLAELEGH
jgi:hypothetical protein